MLNELPALTVLWYAGHAPASFLFRKIVKNGGDYLTKLKLKVVGE